ncbi:alpha/beta hydrolase [Sphingomonas sp. AOB5]|uniref:alpha/beta fold hydrolase n=1 Tax=Sphingomonas sp. AOB5 TaxID=3034017 RepID=UPI0023F953C8|nr:alpha/beta hydrolase [Sphingomonas sp. AOB5]MDF7776286.1 alpha/beta hydrolase [Sphingomonas sp. AOB5]
MITRTLLAAALLVTPLAIAPAAATPAAASLPGDQITQMGHISIRAIGKGKPVFLIPGLSSPRAVWDGVAPELAKTHRVYLVQINGFGGDDPRNNLTPDILEGVLAELHAYIRENKAQGSAVVGHSLGGLLGMMLAARHPEDVGRLMVVDAFPFIGTMFGAADVAAIEPRAVQMRDMIAGGHERAKAAAGTPVTSDPGGNQSITAEGRIKVANWALQADMRVVATALYEDMVTDMRPHMGKIAAKPFTVLYAAGMGEPMAKAIWEPAYAGTTAKLVAIPGSYHFIMLDQPALFATELAKFLAE